ncbi:hypothetical protein E4U54_003694 [Claviceps lovelessii]|nr:hypothetical protein E4U54_003694 [Claviceps lovelessii]
MAEREVHADKADKDGSGHGKGNDNNDAIPMHGSQAPQPPEAMAATSAWKPSFDRRQSWSKEEHKHDLQMKMPGVRDVKTGAGGFTEKGV